MKKQIEAAKSEASSPRSPRSEWLRAAFGAPALLFISAAVLTACLGDGSLTARLGSSIRGLILAPLAGLLYGSILLGVDLVLALVRVRRLPVGLKAWFSACVATIVGGISSAIVGGAIKGSVADETFAVVVLVIVCAAAVGARIVFGQRPERPPAPVTSS